MKCKGKSVSYGPFLHSNIVNLEHICQRNLKTKKVLSSQTRNTLSTKTTYILLISTVTRFLSHCHAWLILTLPLLGKSIGPIAPFESLWSDT